MLTLTLKISDEQTIARILALVGTSELTAEGAPAPDAPAPKIARARPGKRATTANGHVAPAVPEEVAPAASDHPEQPSLFRGYRGCARPPHDAGTGTRRRLDAADLGSERRRTPTRSRKKTKFAKC